MRPGAFPAGFPLAWRGVLWYNGHNTQARPGGQERNPFMEKRLLFVLNPQAGKGEIRQKLLPVIQIFNEYGYEVTVRPTRRAGELPSIVEREAPRYDLLVASGGDGTLNETIAGLMACPRPIPLGDLPAGTVNDFATSLSIPKEMTAAARAVMEGEIFPCDVGRFGDRYFSYVAAFGAFTQVSYETPQQTKNLLGRAAYFLEGIRSLPQIKGYQARIRWEKGEVQGRFLFGMVSNATSVGGFGMRGPEKVRMNDGLLEVTLVREPKNAMELQAAVNSLLMPQQSTDHEAIVRFQTPSLEVSFDQPLPWTLDGEFGGEAQTALIRNCPRVLPILVRPPEKG